MKEDWQWDSGENVPFINGSTNLFSRVLVLPHVDELGEHGVWPAVAHLAQPPKHRELSIRHTHVILQQEEPVLPWKHHNE